MDCVLLWENALHFKGGKWTPLICVRLATWLPSFLCLQLQIFSNIYASVWRRHMVVCRSVCVFVCSSVCLLSGFRLAQCKSSGAKCIYCHDPLTFTLPEFWDKALFMHCYAFYAIRTKAHHSALRRGVRGIGTLVLSFVQLLLADCVYKVLGACEFGPRHTSSMLYWHL